MSRNLIGHFSAMPDCKEYTVKIIADRSSNEFEEIYLAGGSPFVVTYDTSSTPFEPLRLSRASINVVADEKFLDVFSDSPQGTRVVLEDASGNTEWTGFLTSNLLNMPDGCGNENFSLEAQDCIYTLEHYKYELKTGKKQIVTFEDILSQIATRCTDINTLVVDGSILSDGGSYIYMNQLTVSEQNFFTSDTDEPWTLKEVLEELCKYLGFTAIQWKDRLILFDMQAHTNSVVNGDSPIDVQMHCEQYFKDSGFSAATVGTTPNYMKVIPLKENLLLGKNSDISLETLYNKVEVKDSFYEIDHFIPDLFEDNYLTNRQGEFWKCNQYGTTGKFKYINKKGKPEEEEKDEGDYVHYIRNFDHKNYHSIYRDRVTLNVVTINNPIKLSNVNQSFNENPSEYEGTYSINATFKNTDSVSHTIHVTAELRYNWWDENDMMNDYNTTHDDITFTLAAGASRDVQLGTTTWYDFRAYPTYTTWYTIDGGSKTYGIYESSDSSSKYVGATIVDVATFDRPMSTSQYNYETEANINFDRYLMIHQCGQPDRQHPYSDWEITTGQGLVVNPLSDSQIASYYPSIFELNDGYTNPMIIDNKAYIYLDATAIYERYDVPYINPDWTDENSKYGGVLGLFTKMNYVCTRPPCLIFTLKIGNKYWSSKINAWTTTPSSFVVNLGTDKTDDDEVDFTGWWNEDHPVLNNVSWTDWAGAKGYKIPLENDMDWNQDIVFKVHLPSKQQELRSEYTEGVDYQNNNYCWIKDLKLGFTTKDKENYDNSDVVYRNIINSGSVNTLGDITMRFTTYPGEGMHSYSNVGYNGRLINKVIKTGLGNASNNFEEQKIKAYVNQYSTNTIKQSLTLANSIGPLDRIKDPTLSGKYFGILGGKIDYAKGSQDLTLVETKPWQVD